MAEEHPSAQTTRNIRAFTSGHAVVWGRTVKEFAGQARELCASAV